MIQLPLMLLSNGLSKKFSKVKNIHIQNKAYINMLEAGIIAPTKNAASVSGMLLTTECVITEVKSAEPAMPMGGGMPGMM